MALHHDLGQARAKRLANVEAFHTGNVACEVVNVVFLIFLRAPLKNHMVRTKTLGLFDNESLEVAANLHVNF